MRVEGKIDMRDEFLIKEESCMVCGAVLESGSYYNKYGICKECIDDIKEDFGDYNNIDIALENKRPRKRGV